MTKLHAADAASLDRLGWRVYISGEVAVVGAPFDDDGGPDSGSAYVYQFNGDAWLKKAKLTASDAAPEDEFGNSVSVSADTILVGAKRVGANTGAAYVYRFDGSEWIEVAKLTASDGEGGDLFARSVSLRNDVAIIGAQYDDDMAPNAGAAYIFRFNGSDWVEEAKLTASDGAVNDEFGQAVSIHKNVAVVGAPFDDDDGMASGSAYVYRFDGRYWNEETKLTASDADPGDVFGGDIALDEQLAVISAIADDSHGSVHIFQFDGNEWAERVKLKSSDAEAYDVFGYAVSLSGNLLVVGAWKKDDVGPESGSAYVYRRNGSNWYQQSKLSASDAAANDKFGWSVSVSDDMCVVGAPFDDGASGSAYFFRGLADDCNRNGVPDECDVASTIPITNPGFEKDAAADGDALFEIDGWSVSHGAGTLNPDHDAYPQEAPEGFNVAFIEICAGGTICQVLTHVLSADTIYSLKVDVGNRLDVDFLGYRVQLYAGRQLLVQDDNLLVPTPGTFETSTLTYDVLPGDAVGQPLEICLEALAGTTGEVDFDIVRLSRRQDRNDNGLPDTCE